MAEANGRRITRSFFLILALAVGLAASAFAQPIGTPSPRWTELTPSERQFLAPFASEWDKWDAQRKAKWRGIAQRYPKMSPDEQERLRQQMTTWSALSPAERAAARERYKNLKTPEQKQEMRQKWEQYQNLPPEKKRELASKPPPGSPPIIRGHPPPPPPPPPPTGGSPPPAR